MVERDRDAEAVFFRKTHPFPDDVPVVEDTVVGEHDPLGKSCCPARVLDVDRIVEIEHLSPCNKLVIADLLPLLHQVRPGIHAIVRDIPEEDHVFQEREFFRVQSPGPGLLRIRTGFVEHPDIIRGFEPSLQNQGLDLGLLQNIFQFIRPVCRVDIHHDGADRGCGKLDGDPFGIIHCPDSHPVTFLDSQRHQPLCEAIDLGEEVPIGPPDILVDRDYRFRVRMAGGDRREHFTESETKKGLG